MPTDVVKTSTRSQTLISGKVVALTPGVRSIPMFHMDKPGKFGRGVNFKRCQQKMKFYITTLNLVGCLIEEALVIIENKIDNQKWIALAH